MIPIAHICLHIMCAQGRNEMPYSIIRELVDSLCRDDADMPIVRVHTKAF